MNMLRKLLPVGLVALALAVTPAQLTAEETAGRAPQRETLNVWLSSVWSGLTDWFREGSCAIDPNGCPSGDASSVKSAPVTIQGSCAIDPFGCPEHG